MCGRYFIDDDMMTEIEKIANNISLSSFHSGEIFPTNKVPIIQSQGSTAIITNMTWGFPNYKEKGVIINARSETAKKKPTFKRTFENGRCIIPAAGFFEWDKTKNKIMFKHNHEKVLYMVGLWKTYEGVPRFVILTTAANESVKDIHSRMPLIIEKNEINNWLNNEDFTDFILSKNPCQLNKIQEYEQTRLNL